MSIVLAIAFLSLGATPAHGDQADQHYKRALKYYESKDYPRAIKEFQAAYRARQLPRILLNIGQVYRKLGMASTALKFYEHFLRVEPHPKPEIKAEVDRYIEQTNAMLDPPEFVAPPVPGATGMSAAEAAAAAVAAAPSNVTSVTVPELYTEDDPTKGGDAQRGRAPKPVGTAPPLNPLVTSPSQPSGALPLLPATPGATTDTAPGTRLSGTAPPNRPTPQTPFYKKGWFWGVVGGVAGVVLITGIAVGAQRAGALPPDILYPAK